MASGVEGRGSVVVREDFWEGWCLSWHLKNSADKGSGSLRTTVFIADPARPGCLLGGDACGTVVPCWWQKQAGLVISERLL